MDIPTAILHHPSATFQSAAAKGSYWNGAAAGRAKCSGRGSAEALFMQRLQPSRHLLTAASEGSDDHGQ
jgi:hypothetical protein